MYLLSACAVSSVRGTRKAYHRVGSKNRIALVSDGHVSRADLADRVARSREHVCTRCAARRGPCARRVTNSRRAGRFGPPGAHARAGCRTRRVGGRTDAGRAAQEARRFAQGAPGPPRTEEEGRLRAGKSSHCHATCATLTQSSRARSSRRFTLSRGRTSPTRSSQRRPPTRHSLATLSEVTTRISRRPRPVPIEKEVEESRKRANLSASSPSPRRRING